MCSVVYNVVNNCAMYVMLYLLSNQMSLSLTTGTHRLSHLAIYNLYSFQVENASFLKAPEYQTH
jgi:hypothetical protein